MWWYYFFYSKFLPDLFVVSFYKSSPSGSTLWPFGVPLCFRFSQRLTTVWLLLIFQRSLKYYKRGTVQIRSNDKYTPVVHSDLSSSFTYDFTSLRSKFLNERYKSIVYYTKFLHDIFSITTSPVLPTDLFRRQPPRATLLTFDTHLGRGLWLQRSKRVTLTDPLAELGTCHSF